MQLREGDEGVIAVVDHLEVDQSMKPIRVGDAHSWESALKSSNSQRARAC